LTDAEQTCGECNGLFDCECVLFEAVESFVEILEVLPDAGFCFIWGACVLSAFIFEVSDNLAFGHGGVRESGGVEMIALVRGLGLC